MKAIKLLAAPLAAIAAAMVAAIPANAQSIYRLDASVWDSGVLDLTSMDGYYADRMEGPLSTSIQFKGKFACDTAVSASHPFQLIGNGKQLEILAVDTGFQTLPMILTNATGKTGTSTFKLSKGCYESGYLEIGRYNKFMYTFDAGSGGGKGLLKCPEVVVRGGQLHTDNYWVFAPMMTASISVLDSGSITGTAGIQLGMQDTGISPNITAFMGITNGTVTAGGTDLNNGRAFTIMFNGGTWNRDAARVVIGEGGLLCANCISHYGAGNSHISFDGGRYKPTSGESASLQLFSVKGHISWGSDHYPEPHMTVEGINGHPIDVEIALNRNLSGGSYDGTRQINVTGAGGFTKRGAGTLTFNRLNANSSCDYTGPTTILGGGIVVTNAVFKPGRGVLSVAEGAFLNLNSFNTEFTGATGAGIVSNGAAAVSTLSLGYGNADAAFSVAVGERVNVVKTGTGTLTVSGVALANTCDLTVEAGTVVFAGDSSSYGTVTVASGATLDASAVEFGCASLVKQPGATVLTKPKATTVIMR